MSKFPQLMSVSEFIKCFNESVSDSIGANKLYALVREKGFPSIKIGGRYYILADKVSEWLESQNYKNRSGDNE